MWCFFLCDGQLVFHRRAADIIVVVAIILVFFLLRYAVDICFIYSFRYFLLIWVFMYVVCSLCNQALVLIHFVCFQHCFSSHYHTTTHHRPSSSIWSQVLQQLVRCSFRFYVKVSHVFFINMSFLLCLFSVCFSMNSLQNYNVFGVHYNFAKCIASYLPRFVS